MAHIPPPLSALLGSVTIYPSLYLMRLGIHPSFVHIVKTREAISILHCTLQTILSVYCLRRHARSLTYAASTEKNGNITIDSQTPIIATKSTFANSITAIETGYLLQDSIVLLHAYYQRHSSKGEPPNLKGWNTLHLGLHHAVLGTLLLVLQFYIAQGRERGILVIIALHLMNASSIPGTVRWFLRNFQPHRKALILAMTVVYLCTFAVFRVYIIYWILVIFAQQQGISAGTAISRLRAPCMIGTGTIAAVNAAWLMSGCRKFVLGTLLQRKRDKKA